MYLKLNRTQKTKIGTLRAGVVYDFDPKDRDQAAIAKRLKERKFATELSQKEFEQEIEEARAREHAHLAETSEGQHAETATGKAIREQERKEAEQKAKAEADAKAKEEAAAKKADAK